MATLAIRTTPSLMRIKRTLQSGFALITKTIVFLFIALVGGTVSSWYAVEGGTRINTERIGPWTKWSNAGRPGADPYSRVRFNKRSELVFNADQATRYEATSDSAGRLLHSSCDYVLEGMQAPGAWWSLAVFDAAGRLIRNPSERYGFNSATIARQVDDSFTIYLARDARPFNWIPTSRAGRLVIMIEIQPQTGRETIDTDRDTVQLPQIRRLGCR
jgi:hypothetical protein